MTYTLHHGDCLEVLATLPDCSVDAIVTDPPAGIAFMGKAWDKDKGGKAEWIDWMFEVALQCRRVIKPGGHALVWAIPRTSHWTGDAWEEAGWQVRDKIYHVFGSGFPKSADVSKRIDLEQQKQWIDVRKAIDNFDTLSIMEAWKKHLSNATNAGLLFAKNQTGIGTSTPKSGFALANVLLNADHANSDALALVAELSSREALPTLEQEKNSALAHADASELQSLARYAGNSQRRQTATFTPIGTVLFDVKHSLNASTGSKLKAVEALRILLGEKPSLRQEATNALCAALTSDLKLITLSQSKTFQSYDTIRQMDCASAINVIITESMAESLILFTADTLRSKAIDKAAGAEREVLAEGKPVKRMIPGADQDATGSWIKDNGREFVPTLTAPATPEAKQWAGWGTALKPAAEEWWLFRRPLEGTVAANVLKHGTGAINVDRCRIPCEGDALRGGKHDGTSVNKTHEGWDRPWKHDPEAIARAKERSDANQAKAEQLGRWPANFTHDGSDEVTALLGDAARFFYSPKASKADRDKGCEGMEERGNNRYGDFRGTDDHSPKTQDNNKSRNFHPTVKPVDLMTYLCRLITPPGGTILDPFTGSGSTGKAAVLEDFKFIGIEREAEYIEIAKARIDAAIKFRSEFLF